MCTVQAEIVSSRVLSKYDAREPHFIQQVLWKDKTKDQRRQDEQRVARELKHIQVRSMSTLK